MVAVCSRRCPNLNIPARCSKFTCAISRPSRAKPRWRLAFPGHAGGSADFSHSLRQQRYFGFSVNEPVAEGVITPTRDIAQNGDLTSLTVTAPATKTAYTIGAIGEKQVRFGGGLWLMVTIT